MVPSLSLLVQYSYTEVTHGLYTAPTPLFARRIPSACAPDLKSSSLASARSSSAPWQSSRTRHLSGSTLECAMKTCSDRGRALIGSTRLCELDIGLGSAPYKEGSGLRRWFLARSARQRGAHALSVISVSGGMQIHAGSPGDPLWVCVIVCDAPAPVCGHAALAVCTLQCTST